MTQQFELIRITRNGDSALLQLPKANTRILAGVLQVFLQRTTKDHTPKQSLPVTGNMLDDLDAEMANDAVAESVAAQNDLQELTARRILTEVIEAKEPVHVEDYELIDLAFWFNRLKHDFHKEKEHCTESILCSMTANALLDATL